MRSSPSTLVLEKAARLTGLLFLALIPLATLIPVATPVTASLTQDLILRWISALLFSASAYLFFIRGSFSLKLGMADVTLLLLLVWSLLSANHSKEAFNSYYAFRSFLALALFWFSLKSVWTNEPRAYDWFEKSFWGTAVVAGAWVFVSTAGRWVLPSLFERIFPNQGPFPNANIAAGFLGMALLFAALKLVRGGKLSYFGLALVLAGWSMTESRGAFIAMTGTVVLYLVLNMKGLEERLSKWKTIQWGFFGAAAFVAILAAVPVVNRLFHAYEMDHRAYFRIDIWESALKMIIAQPIWGFGPGTFGEVYPFYRPGELWNTTTPFAHNEYLQVAAECGLPALFLTLLFLSELARKSLSAFVTLSVFQRTPAKVRAAEVAFYLVVFEALHSLVDFTFHEWSHRLVLLGFVTYSLGSKKDGENLSVSVGLSRLAAFLVTAVAILLCLWLLGIGSLKDHLAKVYNAKSVMLLKNGILDDAEVNARKSLDFRPRYSDPWNSLGVIEYARASFSKGSAEREKHFNTAKENYGMAMQLSPYSTTPEENEVENMVQQGRLREALDLQKELIEKIPASPIYRLNLGRLLMRMGRSSDALAAFGKAIDIDGYYLPAYLGKAQTLEALGKKGEALKIYEQMRDLLQKLGLKDPSGQIEASIKKIKSGR